MRFTTLAFALASVAWATEPGLAAGIETRNGRHQHEDTRLGFRVRVPQGWERIPLQMQERYIVAKYLSDKRYEYPDKASGYDKHNRPFMLVIALPKDGQRGTYTDYKTYLKGTYERAGYHVADEGTASAGDLEAATFDVRTREGNVHDYLDMAPRRITTWVYDLESVRIAVHFEAKEEHVFAKIEKELSRCLASLKPIAVEDALHVCAELPGRGALAALDVKERNRLLRESEESLHARAQAELPRGWKAKRAGRFLVLNHADAGYAKKLAQQGEAVYAWLEDAFPAFAPRGYVRAPILRVCSDWDEAQAMSVGSGFDDASGVGIDIVTYKSELGAQGGSFDRVSTRVKEIWFSEKDPELYATLPRWVERGVHDMLADSRAKGKKLVFKDDDDDLEDLRESIRGGEMPPLRDFVRMSDRDFDALDTGYEQAGLFMQFLKSKAAARDKRTKGLVDTYMNHLVDVVAEVGEVEKKQRAEAKEPETEAEEDALYRERVSRRAGYERQILDETFERTFGAWTDREWRALEKAFRGSF
ncbi:MAG: hypothetical protein GY711_02840 [bacterium]|nr:hypothetical protein [bacterium]